MKLEALVGTILLGSLIACGGSKDEAAADAKPAAVTVPDRDTDETKPEGDTSGDTSTTTNATTPAPATDPGTTAPVNPPAPVAETCETLAAKQATPAGKLTDVASVNGMFDITPADVYATEDAEGLHIVLTETANACAYHTNNLQTANKNELVIDFPKTATEFGPGTFKPSQFSQEAGTVCFPDDLPPGVSQTGSASGGGSARGKVTITAKTATLVEGTVAITSFDGSKTTFTFSAPICAAFQPTEETTCCGPADQ